MIDKNEPADQKQDEAFYWTIKMSQSEYEWFKETLPRITALEAMVSEFIERAELQMKKGDSYFSLAFIDRAKNLVP